MLQGVLAGLPSPGSVFPVGLPSNNSLFFWKSGTFQRLNGFNEPQCCASAGCWVSGMKLMIMCPAECHCVLPTVMVMEPVWVFFSPLTEGGCCLFCICYSCHHHSADVCIEVSAKYLLLCNMSPLCILFWYKEEKRTTEQLLSLSCVFVPLLSSDSCRDSAACVKERLFGKAEGKDELT